MIDKKNIWFLTLFSLILVLSVYYITMPKELLLTGLNDLKETNDEYSKVEETSALSVMKVEDKEETKKEMETLKEVLLQQDAEVSKKSEAFDKMKQLDINSSKEEELETKIEQELGYESFIKIDGDKIKVVVSLDKKDTKIANNIMRLIQSNYDTKKYITVEFK